MNPYVFCAVLVSAALARLVVPAIPGSVELLQVGWAVGDRTDERPGDGTPSLSNQTAVWIEGLADASMNNGCSPIWARAAESSARRAGLLAQKRWWAGDQSGAVELLQCALYLDPSDGSNVVLLSRWSLELGGDHRRRLRQVLDTILESVPDNAVALSCRGWLSYLDGSIREAGLDLRRALELEPLNEQTVRNMARFLVATGFDQQRAEQLLLLGDREWPRGGFYYDLVQLYMAQRRYGAAARFVVQLLAERPEDGYAREVVGLYYLHIGNAGAALDHFRAARSLGVSESRLLVEIGDALSALGRTVEAMEAYRVAADQDDSRAVNRISMLERGEQLTLNEVE